LSIFGISVVGNGEPDEFYVGYDEVLRDWLLAEDYEPDPSNPSNLIVTAPVGYLFYYYGSLVPEYALVEGDETSRTSIVAAETALFEKVNSLSGALNQVEPVQFYSFGIDESRITYVVRPDEVFGIRAGELGDSVEHYVGHDPSLFDWLVADNYEPCDRESSYKVKAPEGYVFLFDNISPKNEEDGGDEYEYVSIGSPQNDKALMLLEAMQFVSPEEFDSAEINNDRILNFLFY
jgi:hypothetical protein